VAEGIETAQQLDALNQMVCPIGQGYFFAAPLSAEEMTTRLAKRL